jgi:hypothetical protein
MPIDCEAGLRLEWELFILGGHALRLAHLLLEQLRARIAGMTDTSAAERLLSAARLAYELIEPSLSAARAWPSPETVWADGCLLRGHRSARRRRAGRALLRRGDPAGARPATSPRSACSTLTWPTSLSAAGTYATRRRTPAPPGSRRS